MNIIILSLLAFPVFATWPAVPLSIPEREIESCVHWGGKYTPYLQPLPEIPKVIGRTVL